MEENRTWTEADEKLHQQKFANAIAEELVPPMVEKIERDLKRAFERYTIVEVDDLRKATANLHKVLCNVEYKLFEESAETH